MVSLLALIAMKILAFFWRDCNEKQENGWLK
jgi:hypothetical protein